MSQNGNVKVSEQSMITFEEDEIFKHLLKDTKEISICFVNSPSVSLKISF